MQTDLLYPDQRRQQQLYKFKRLIQGPNSRFIEVQCSCGEQHIIYSHSTTEIKCKKCNKPICKPTAGKAKITDRLQKREKDLN